MAGNGGERCAQSGETDIKNKPGFECKGVIGSNEAKHGDYIFSSLLLLCGTDKLYLVS